jgi:hypothetical protein
MSLDVSVCDEPLVLEPLLPPLIVGGVTVLAGGAAALVRPAGRHPFRIAALVLVVGGLVGLGWGLWRGFDPGTGGVLAAGEGSAGAGPWLTAAGGLVALVCGYWLLSGRSDVRIDPSVRHPGIQL